ncbi:Pectinesterase 1 [Morella rubra]|uniref:pectinesterase n=1 Tax=Morella rubra TaxID=262757 RepID=A0A6A1UGB8_9ROSI|nr:Pectinesterase 1 [Morella rubra]KAB1199342.1 Pectinesterase 1 [Morella rubra]
MDSVNIFKGYGKVNDLEDQSLPRNSNTNATTLKPLITTVSIIAILLLTLTIGLMLGALMHQTDDHTPGFPSLSSDSAESIRAVCSVTRYPESCVSGISSLKFTCKKPADPEAIFKLSLRVSVTALSKFKTSISNSNEAALRDCQTQIEDALGRLNDSLAAMDVGRGEKALTEAKISDLQTWISAAMTDQETCLDGLEEMESTSLPMVKTNMQKAKEYTSNSLAILANMHTLLDKYHMSLH